MQLGGCFLSCWRNVNANIILGFHVLLLYEFECVPPIKSKFNICISICTTRFDSLSWGWILLTNWHRQFCSFDFIKIQLLINDRFLKIIYDFIRRHKRMYNKERQLELEFYALIDMSNDGGCLLKYWICLWPKALKGNFYGTLSSDF